MSKRERSGSSTITFKLRGSAAVAGTVHYEAVVKAPGGSKQLTFTARR